MYSIAIYGTPYTDDCRVVIKNSSWELAKFDSIEAFNKFSKMMGFGCKDLTGSSHEGNTIVRFYTCTHDFDDDLSGGFTSTDEFKSYATPFIALSNGSLVTCYFWNDGKTIHIRRPNPNAEGVYKIVNRLSGQPYGKY